MIIIVCFDFSDVLYHNNSVNKVVFKTKFLCLSVNPAGWQQGLAHHMPNSPLIPCKYHKMSTGLHACAHVCFKLSVPHLSVHLSVCSLIYYLPLSFLSILCLSSSPGFPNVKRQQRGRQRGWRTFLMEGFYILTSLPSLLLNLVQWGGKARRQTEKKNINKLHINWSATGFAQTVTMSHSHAHLPTGPLGWRLLIGWRINLIMNP